MNALKRFLRRVLNAAAGLAGYEFVRRDQPKAHDWLDCRQFLPLRETLEGARQAGQSLGDFIDAKHNAPGVTRDHHDRLVQMGAFAGRTECVCEIGPGSGRYLEKVLTVCRPARYEIYETSGEWADWLVRSYPVVALPTDGHTLSSTPSGSVDLLLAHKVFVCLLYVNSCSYFREIVRVMRAGGRVVFDVMTENCVGPESVDAWLKTGVNARTYPAIMPKRVVTEYFEENGFELLGTTLVPMRPAQTESFVFRRRSA